MSALSGDSATPLIPAVSAAHSTSGRGVAASSAQGIALEATATKDTAVFAHSDSGAGVDARTNGTRAAIIANARNLSTAMTPCSAFAV